MNQRNGDSNNLHLSIVSGTYNRIKSLQRMVESARKSIRFNLAYEIVLVDGGSTDGTIEWCKSQDDIVLIEHGKLLGAVKAFNDGAYRATGDYVILANDDIEFVEDSIYVAWLFMQNNIDANIGIGCFYQNRGGKDWHIERMPVIVNGRQQNLYYGQVCIIPRWLGNYCQWWGNYLHTYGGDNQLSSMVYETGYQILAINGGKVIDHEVKDNLRKINNVNGQNDPRAINGHHPDSYAWYRKWRNKENRDLVGPVVRSEPIMPNLSKEVSRILYLPIYEPGWTVQKEQKRGLREALQEIGIVEEYDYVGRFQEAGEKIKDELFELTRIFQPTIFLSQLHNESNLDAKFIKRLKAITGAYFVNWNGDYWPDNLLTRSGYELAAAFDLMTSVNLDAVEKYLAKGINAKYWQIGFEPDGVVNEVGESVDIIFLGTGYSGDRQKLGRFLKEQPYNTAIYGSGWPNGYSKGVTMYDFRASAILYRGAKLAIGDSQWPDTGFVSNRIFQILAAGKCVLCHQWFRGIENLGLKDAENCIIWGDLTDLKVKIDYYMNNQSYLSDMANRGQKLAFERHSFRARVNELLKMIGDKKQSLLFESWR